MEWSSGQRKLGRFAGLGYVALANVEKTMPIGYDNFNP
jgi:hypothetical protein